MCYCRFFDFFSIRVIEKFNGINRRLISSSISKLLTANFLKTIGPDSGGVTREFMKWVLIKVDFQARQIVSQIATMNTFQDTKSLVLCKYEMQTYTGVICHYDFDRYVSVYGLLREEALY